MLTLMMAAALAQAAPGPAWRSFYRDDRGEAFVDAASLRRGDGDTFEVTTRAVFATVLENGMKAGNMRYVYDCRRRTAAMRHFTAFNERGAQLDDSDATGPVAEHQAVPAGSPNDAILNEFCPAPGT